MRTHAAVERFEDPPITGELSLARAVVLYHVGPGRGEDGEGVDDLGFGLVLGGEYANSAEVLDLASGRIREVALGTEVVVLDQVHDTTLDYIHILRLATDTIGSENDTSVPEPLRQYGQTIALSVLRRIGFNALTRSIFLKIGFRDLVRDLDPNDEMAIRIQVGPGGLAVIRFDCVHNTLIVDRSGPKDTGRDFEGRLLAAFPAAEVRRASEGVYQLRFALPMCIRETRQQISEIRRGLLGLYSLFEPMRAHYIRKATEVFGPRDTLQHLEPCHHADTTVRLRRLSGVTGEPVGPGVM